MAKNLSIMTNKRKKFLTLLLAVVSIGALASVKPEGGKPRQSVSTGNRLLSIKPQFNMQRFSLRSGFTYSADRLLDAPAPQPFELMTSTVTFQKGNNTYIIPLKKKPALLDRVNFCPQPNSLSSKGTQAGFSF